MAKLPLDSVVTGASVPKASAMAYEVSADRNWPVSGASFVRRPQP
jgi:hypothetical protein